MWTKDKPTKTGWYYVIIKPVDCTAVMAILPVTAIKDKMRVEIGDEQIEFNSKEIGIITHWSGPVSFPIISEEMIAEIGEVDSLS